MLIGHGKESTNGFSDMALYLGLNSVAITPSIDSYSSLTDLN